MKIEKCFSVNESENTTCSNLWDATKETFQRKFTAFKSISENNKGLKSIISASTLRNLKKISKLKTKRQTEKIDIKAEISGREN